MHRSQAWNFLAVGAPSQKAQLPNNVTFFYMLKIPVYILIGVKSFINVLTNFYCNF